MDIKTYISSGILEHYVLGSVSKQEKQEVECMTSIYPELKEELEKLQTSIEEMVMSQAQTPPPALKLSILEAIKSVEQEPKESIQKEDNAETTKVVSLSASSSGSNYYQWVAAASIIGVLSLGFLFKNSSDKVTAQAQKINTVTKELLVIKSEKELIDNEYSFVTNPLTKRIVLSGTENTPEAVVSIYWNKEQQKVYSQVESLPHVGGEQDYQLWAIVGGVPVDLGLVDGVKVKDLQEVQTVITDAAAFAITIEPKGGSKVPTLEQMVVIGEVI